MSKNHSILLLLCLVLSAAASAQTGPRMEARLQRSLQQAAPTELISTLVKTQNADAEALAAQIRADGQYATAIDAATLTVRATPGYLRLLGQKAQVGYMQQSHRLVPLMDQARQFSGVDRVHSGDGLDTPFTGRGVVIGVIDQGFEYRHIAFLDSDNQTRVKAVWNRWGYSTGTDQEPTTDIPATSDGIASSAHATHVAGIAAGSHISENDWYGVAPDAELVMIPSEFDTNEVLEDVKYISDMARAEGKPWVVNMSFGGNLGSHDGTDPAYTTLDDLITAQPGGMIVAAVGNDGLTHLHASHAFTAPAGTDPDTIRLAVNPGSYATIVDIWCDQTDSLSHFTLRPFIYDGGKRTYLEEAVVNEIVAHEIAPFNRKEHYTVTAPTSAIHSYGYNSLLGLELAGHEGTSLHAWTTTNLGTFATVGEAGYAVPDNAYTVCAPAHGMLHGVSVASYNSTKVYDNVRGQRQVANFGEVGEISTFSNRGPSLHGVPQPTLAAPGAMVISSLSKYEQGFTKEASYIAGDVKRGLKHFYYGAYAGTSMATPMVTGSIALWLQANPLLTHEQILDILRTTAVMPDGTETDAEGWNAQWGFGRLDTYEGLKAALRLADENGIGNELAATTPFTLSREARQWRVLFNNDEPWATLTLTDLNGRRLSSQHLGHVKRGQETAVDLSTLPKGLYLLTLSAPRAQITKKMIIE